MSSSKPHAIPPPEPLPESEPLLDPELLPELEPLLEPEPLPEPPPPELPLPPPLELLHAVPDAMAANHARTVTKLTPIERLTMGCPPLPG